MTVNHISNGSANVAENPYVKIWIEDNILFCVYENKLNIDLEIANECVELRLEYAKGVSYPVVIDIKGIISITKEAREYFSSKGAESITAGAFIINSPLTKILGNIFLTVNKPQTPAKLFTNEKAAMKWLKKYQ